MGSFFCDYVCNPWNGALKVGATLVLSSHSDGTDIVLIYKHCLSAALRFYAI